MFQKYRQSTKLIMEATTIAIYNQNRWTNQQIAFAHSFISIILLSFLSKFLSSSIY